MPKVSIIQTQVVPNWNVDAIGNWFDSSKWSPQIVPGGYDRDASINITFSTVRTITINDHVTLRNLTITLGNSNNVAFAFSTGKKIYFKSKTTCTITVNANGTNPQFNSGGETVLQSDITVNNAGRFDWNALISGTISNFIKSGSSVLNLTNVNTFIALITVNAGTLGVNADSGFGDSSNAIILSGGTLSLGGNINRNITISANTTIQLTAIVISGTITNTGSNTLKTQCNSGTTEYAGTITLSTTWSFTSGIHKLSGTHNGTGSITNSINTPIFLVTGSITNSTGTITGLNIKGNGSIAKAITIPTTGTIEASDGGSTPGTLTITNNLVLGSSGSVTVRTNGSTVSKIAITGNLTSRGTINFPDSSLNTGTYDIFTYTGTLTNSWSNGTGNIGTNSTGKTINLNIDTVNKKIQIIVT